MCKSILFLTHKGAYTIWIVFKSFLHASKRFLYLYLTHRQYTHTHTHTHTLTMVKNLSLTSLFFKKNTKDTNRPWSSSKEQIESNSIIDTNFDHDTTPFYEKMRDSSEKVDLTKSDRLLFKTGYFSKSIMEEAIVKPVKYSANFSSTFKGGVAMEMESKDPHRDFRESMEEMIKAYGIKDLDWLQEMLGWYLRANGKKTHGMILGAFVDLLVGFTSSNPNHCSNNLSNYPLSSSSSCSCFSFEVEEGMERK